MKEIAVKGPSDVTVQAVTETSWLEVVDTPPIPSIIQAWDLGEGESSVLTWGYQHPETELIIDDLPARRCATSLGIPVRGTLGLVLVAKKRGIIPAARPVIDQLRECGMYLTNRLVDDVLSWVGE
jgi:predicted nucleic acid-binding protein